jgi:hypothetical protein
MLHVRWCMGVCACVLACKCVSECVRACLCVCACNCVRVYVRACVYVLVSVSPQFKKMIIRCMHSGFLDFLDYELGNHVGKMHLIRKWAQQAHTV